MPVGRIERVMFGSVMQRAERNDNGFYVCHAFGSNINPILKASLDEVADYLRKNPQAGVRMNPGWSKIVRNVFIDGVAR